MCIRDRVKARTEAMQPSRRLDSHGRAVLLQPLASLIVGDAAFAPGIAPGLAALLRLMVFEFGATPPWRRLSRRHPSTAATVAMLPGAMAWLLTHHHGGPPLASRPPRQASLPLGIGAAIAGGVFGQLGVAWRPRGLDFHSRDAQGCRGLEGSHCAQHACATASARLARWQL
eukprot:2806298-Alexandrium_andersonii.AAC.2